MPRPPRIRPIGPLGQRFPKILARQLRRAGAKAQLARDAGLSPATIADILHGRFVASAEIIAKILLGLKKDWKWLDEVGLSPSDLYPSGVEVGVKT